MSKFEFGLNPIWLLPCAMIALGFSLFLYFRYKSIWDAKWNLYLGISRFLGVFALLFLLINPLWRQIENQIVKPKVQIIVDDPDYTVRDRLLLVDSIGTSTFLLMADH